MYCGTNAVILLTVVIMNDIIDIYSFDLSLKKNKNKKRDYQSEKIP